MEGDVSVAAMHDVQAAIVKGFESAVKDDCEDLCQNVVMNTSVMENDEDNLSDFTDEGACLDAGSADEEGSSIADSNSPLPALSELEWRKGWTRWSKQRRRARMAQFIIAHLHCGNNGRWIEISAGKFELQRWPDIAQEWYEQKERGSDRADATSMLRKGLPRAFPGLYEVKDEARKEGTQYIKRVFAAPRSLMQEVAKCALDPKLEESCSSSEEHSGKERKVSTTSGTGSASKSRSSRSSQSNRTKKQTAPPKLSSSVVEQSPASVEMSEASVFSNTSSPDTSSPPEQGYYTDETVASHHLGSTSSHFLSPSPQQPYDIKEERESPQQLRHMPRQSEGTAMEVKMEESDMGMSEADLSGLLPSDCAGVDSDLYNALMSYDANGGSMADASALLNDPVVEAMDTRYNYTGSTMASLENPEMPSFYHDAPDMDGMLGQKATKGFQLHGLSSISSAVPQSLTPGQPITSMAGMHVVPPNSAPPVLAASQQIRRELPPPPPYHQHGMNLLHLDTSRQPSAQDMEMLIQQVQLRGPWQGKVKVSPDRSALQGGGQIFLFSTGQFPLPQFPTHLVFYSPKLNSMVCVPTMPSNPFTMQGQIPEHVFAETVFVFMMVGDILLAHMLFEYYAEVPNPAMSLFSGQIADHLQRVHDLLGSMTKGCGPTGGAGGQMQGMPQSGGQYQQYQQMMLLTVSLDLRPLARLFLTSPAAPAVLSEQFGNGQRLENVALDRGHRQMANCLTTLRQRFEKQQAGEAVSSSEDPLDLLECNESSPEACVMSLCKALMELKTAADAEESAPKSEDDSRSTDGNAADDENSEPEFHSSAVEHKKPTARVALAEPWKSNPAQQGPVPSFAHAHQQNMQRAVPASPQVKFDFSEGDSSVEQGLAELYSPKKLSLEDLAPRSQPLYWMPNVLPVLDQKNKSLHHQRSVRLTTAEQLRRVQDQYQHAVSQLVFLKKALHQLQQEQRTSVAQLTGMRHGLGMLNEQYKQASQRRNVAVKMMVNAKNETRHVQRDADKFESDYQDAMRQRDEALQECDTLNGKLQELRQNITTKESVIQELKSKHDELSKLEEKCAELKTSVLQAHESRDKAMEERKVVMGGLDAALKQSDMKSKELQDLQSVHYSMAVELRNTKDKLHDITVERDTQREELKMARREGESAIKRGIKLQDKLRRMEGSALPEGTKGLLEQCEMAQRRCDEVMEERDILSQQLEDVDQQQQELISDHADLEAEYASLRVQFEGVCERLHSVDKDIDEARNKRDWAIGEYNKVLAERDKLRQDCHDLLAQKDQAISKQALVVKEFDRVRSEMDALSISEKPRPSPPRPRSPKLTSPGSVSRKHQSLYSRSVNDSAIGSMTESTTVSEYKLQELTMPPKGKDYGLTLESMFYISEIAPGSYAEQEGSLRPGDQIIMVNNASQVKHLTSQETKKLLRSGNSKHGTVLTYLSRHSLPPSKMLQEHTLLSGESVPPSIVPKTAAAFVTAPKTHSPSLPARMVGRIGNLSPTVGRLRRSASTTSSAMSASNLDLRLLGREYDQADGYEPGKRSRRASISSASSCSHTSLSSNYLNLVDDSTSVVSLMDMASEPRLVTVPITPGCGVGFKVHGGNTVGVFVTAIREDGPKDLQSGDQILEVNGHDLRHGTMGNAINLLTSCEGEEVKILAQYNPGKARFMYEAAFDSFYLRCHFDYARQSDSELSFRRGDVLHVVNSANTDDSYLAWRVNTDSSETQLGSIPSIQRSRKLQEHYICKQLKTDSAAGVQLSPYIQVDSKPAPFPRPILLLGHVAKDVSTYLLDNYPQQFARCLPVSSFSTRHEMERELLSNMLVEFVEDNGHFTSTSVEGVREIAERGQHCLLSTGVASIAQLHLANLSPVVFVLRHTPSRESLRLPVNDDPANFIDEYSSSISTDGAIAGSNTASIAEQVLHSVEQQQAQCTWCMVDSTQV